MASEKENEMSFEQFKQLHEAAKARDKIERELKKNEISKENPNLDKIRKESEEKDLEETDKVREFLGIRHRTGEFKVNPKDIKKN